MWKLPLLSFRRWVFVEMGHKYSQNMGMQWDP